MLHLLNLRLDDWDWREFNDLGLRLFKLANVKHLVVIILLLHVIKVHHWLIFNHNVVHWVVNHFWRVMFDNWGVQLHYWHVALHNWRGLFLHDRSLVHDWRLVQDGCWLHDLVTLVGVMNHDVTLLLNLRLLEQMLSRLEGLVLQALLLKHLLHLKSICLLGLSLLGHLLLSSHLSLLLLANSLLLRSCFLRRLLLL